MRIETGKFKIITPTEGMWLCNVSARTFSKEVYMAVDADDSQWEEITEDEKLQLETEWESEIFEEATESDYQNALAELGVDLNG